MQLITPWKVCGLFTPQDRWRQIQFKKKKIHTCSLCIESLFNNVAVDVNVNFNVNFKLIIYVMQDFLNFSADWFVHYCQERSQWQHSGERESKEGIIFLSFTIDASTTNRSFVSMLSKAYMPCLSLCLSRIGITLYVHLQD